jgi:nitrogen fixation protein NifU and related proteins
MMDLRELYQDIILDHGRHPRNFRTIEQPTHFAQGHNPLCGDRVTIYLLLDGDQIADVAFQGRGCAISTAAASLMTEVLKGKTVEEARTLFAQFHARVKCATLSWHALEAALKGGDLGATVKTE